MCELRRFLFLIPVLVLAFTLALRAQDEPSLGDVARQSRQQKQQKDAEAKPPASDAQANVAVTAGSPNSDAQNKDAGKDAQTKDAGVSDIAAKDAAANPPAPKKHVITNEDIGSPFGGNTPQASGTHASGSKSPEVGSDNAKASAETWRTQIQAQKNAIDALQSQITQLNDSIQFAPGNCVSGCLEWNERQKQKQDQVEAMKIQLQQLQQHLEEMQEAARQQGYGSSVYEP